MPVHYKAPWGTPLLLISLFASLILIGTPLLLYANAKTGEMLLGIPVALIPIAILIGGMLFTIRGYVLDGDNLSVQRLFWNTTISLNGLQKVSFDPSAMDRSIRTWGNGGLFSFSGSYRNKKLGKYRAFVTDYKQCVVLDFGDNKIVISPNKPEELAHMLQSVISTIS